VQIDDMNNSRIVEDVHISSEVNNDIDDLKSLVHPMLHGHDNIEMDMTHEHVTNF